MKNLKLFTLIKNKITIKTLSYALFSIAGLLLLWVAATYLYKNQQIITNATTIKPENFTELYFEDHTHLPVKIKTKNSAVGTYTFSFTIHNLENKTMQYKYEVYLLDPNKTVFDQDTVEIKNSDSKTINETFYLPKNFVRTKVIVNLIDQNQQISFWMEGNIK